MSSGKYLLVDKTILPPCYEKVVEARALISSGQVKDISEAVKRTGISRSTYYKYKDYVFALNTDTECRKAVITFTLSHKTGMLGEVLKKLSDSKEKHYKNRLGIFAYKKCAEGCNTH